MVESEVRKLDSSSFVLKIALAIQDLLCLQFLKLFVLALSVKNAIGILIGI